MPAMRPVDYRRPLAQLFSLLPMLRELFRVPHFAIQQRQPQMMMRRDRLRLRAGLSGQLQRLFIRAHAPHARRPCAT